MPDGEESAARPGSAPDGTMSAVFRAYAWSGGGEHLPPRVTREPDPAARRRMPASGQRRAAGVTWRRTRHAPLQTPERPRR